MKLSFAASQSPVAQTALHALIKTYGQATLAEADAIITLGGDGHVLRTLYDALHCHKPVFAMRRTEHVGFLCNEYSAEKLPERIAAAQKVALHPLKLEATLANGEKKSAIAINEIGVIRETPQSARLSITVDGIERIERYSGDGVLVATPAGSTAYNHSCGGPIMPLDANTLVMTAISGFRPRGWRYAVLPQSAHITIKALEINKRPVRIEAGGQVFHNALEASIALDHAQKLTLLFDPDEHLSERIIREQFML